MTADSHLGYVEVGEIDPALARSATATTWTDVGNLFATTTNEEAGPSANSSARCGRPAPESRRHSTYRCAPDNAWSPLHPFHLFGAEQTGGLEPQDREDHDEGDGQAQDDERRVVVTQVADEKALDQADGNPADDRTGQ